MALLSKIFCLPLMLLLLAILSACSETKSASVPTILGTPPRDAMLDVFYEYEFGADGGDNLLNYRIISGPSWLNLEVINGAKPSFRVFGVPTIENGESFDIFKEESLLLVIEVSDGKQSSSHTYGIHVTKNKATFNIHSDAGEGLVSTIDKDKFNKKCVLPDLTPKKGDDGEDIFPFPVLITLEGVPVTRTKIELSLESKFVPELDQGHRDDKNIGFAEPSVDYVNPDDPSKPLTIVFEPGVAACVVSVDIIQDTIIEGSESFAIKMVKLVSGFVDIKDQEESIEIADDEPEVIFEAGDYVITKGSSKEFELSLSVEAKSELIVEVFEDGASKVNDEDFTITPSTVVFNKGESKATFSVAISPALTPNLETKDQVLVLRTDVSKIFDFDPLNITINEWGTDLPVLTTSDSEEVKALTIGTNGNVLVLKDVLNDAPDLDTKVSLIDRKGNVQNFLITPDATISSTNGFDESGAGISYVSRSRNAIYDVAVVVNTLGEISSANPAGNDIYIVDYRRELINDDEYSVEWALQISAESDSDVVAKGVYLDETGNVYVYGYTESNLPLADVAHKAGKDAFLLKIDIDNENEIGTHSWTKMIGSDGDDIATGLTELDGDIFVTGTTTGVLADGASVGLDGFLVRVSASGVQVSINQFGTISDDEVTSIVSNNDRIWVTGFSEGDFEIPEGSTSFDPNAASRGSTDIFSLNYKSSNSLSGSQQYGSSADDKSSKSASIDDFVFIGGEASAAIADGESHLGGADAVVSAINTAVIGSSLSWHNQFGTEGEDKVIDLDVYNDNKIMTLWESFDAGSGVTTYNITPISIDGSKLTD